MRWEKLSNQYRTVKALELVTVIIPVYNVEKYLERCINSVIKQSYSELEIILVDDGSTDKSYEICKRFASLDKRISVIANSNEGVSAARNSGLSLVHGKYVLMVDSDDYIACNMIETLYNAAVETGADVTVCDFMRGKEDNYIFDSDKGCYEIIDTRETLSRIYTDDHNKLRYVVPWIKLYKKELFDSIEYPYGKIFEDIYTTHKIYGRCKSIAVVNSALYYYYQRPDSIMNNNYNLKKLDYLGALEERITFFHQLGFADLEKKAYDELLHSLLWEYSRTRDILHNKDAMRSIAKTFRKYYKKGYVSSYPSDTKNILRLFNQNPELVILYWKISSKLRILKRGEKNG